MFNDEFKIRYTTIPFATFERKHERHSICENITSLSHKHKEIEVLAILSGRAKFFIDTNAYEVEKGDIIIISPYLMHNATIYSEYDLEHYCLCFDLQIIPDSPLRDELEKGLSKAVHVIKGGTTVSQKLSMHIQEAYLAHAENKSGWELKVIGNLSVFFGLLKENGYINKITKPQNTDDISYKIMDYIEKHYTQNITSSDAAAAFYMNQSYFCRIFKRNFGHSFANYVCMYRIEKSKILLKTTNNSIADISMQVGFNSFSYYSKMFKEYINMTPLEYRNDGITQKAEQN